MPAWRRQTPHSSTRQLVRLWSSERPPTHTQSFCKPSQGTTRPTAPPGNWWDCAALGQNPPPCVPCLRAYQFTYFFQTRPLAYVGVSLTAQEPATPHKQIRGLWCCMHKNNGGAYFLLSLENRKPYCSLRIK